MNSLIYIYSLIALLTLAASATASGDFIMDAGSSEMVGYIVKHTIRDSETLIELAREYDVGYNEITAANAGVDPWVPARGTEIVLPTVWILPAAPENGIIINLAEMRLYYFFTNGAVKYVTTYPVGIGSEGSTTPEGLFSITARVENPVWTVPENILREAPELPAVIPPGPDNPLGRYWLQLSANGYGIHGTNRPYGIGRRVSHGCIRLYPEDIEKLHAMTKIGTPVRILNEPVKIGKQGGSVYIEVHPSGMDEQELLQRTFNRLAEKRLLRYIDTSLVLNEVKRSTGLPALISK
jgi:L,D-transpeptidase ErfK/SrfK